MKAASLFIAVLLALSPLFSRATVVVAPLTPEELGSLYAPGGYQTEYIDWVLVHTYYPNVAWYASMHDMPDSEHPDQYMLEVGAPGTPYSQGDDLPLNANGLWWNEEQNNPFVITVDEANYLSLGANGVAAGDSYSVPITQPFNEVLLILRLGANEPSFLQVNSQTVDGLSNLSDLSITGTEPYNSQIIGFKFSYDEHPFNIGQFTLNGNIFPDAYFDLPLLNGWTFTVAGVYNPDLVPEASPASLLAIALLFGVTLFAWQTHKSARSKA